MSPFPVVLVVLLSSISRFLEMDDFSDSFLDNGYDDLETVKLIERQDLVAIGVNSMEQQDYLLDRWGSQSE